MEIENNRQIKDDIIVILKECIKFALLAITLFFVIGVSLLYLFIRFTKIDQGIAAIITGVIVAILIVVVDMKKIHSSDIIIECTTRIARKILNRDEQI
jgi:hypothetical protein